MHIFNHVTSFILTIWRDAKKYASICKIWRRKARLRGVSTGCFNGTIGGWVLATEALSWVPQKLQTLKRSILKSLSIGAIILKSLSSHACVWKCSHFPTSSRYISIIYDAHVGERLNIGLPGAHDWTNGSGPLDQWTWMRIWVTIRYWNCSCHPWHGNLLLLNC